MPFRKLLGGRLEVSVAERLGRLAGAEAVEVQDGGAAAGLDTHDADRLGVALQPELGTRRQPLGPIGQQLDADGAA